MSFLQPNDTLYSCPATCHVCGEPLRSCDSAVVHDGDVRPARSDTTAYGSIGLHTECATILAMRLMYDVMDHKGAEHEPRVVLSLSRIRKAILED
jgi:hypothetical protein